MTAGPTWDALPVRAVQRPTPAARAAAVERMADWARGCGARFESLVLGVDDVGNSTVRAARALAANEAIVTIPRKLILTPDGDVGLWLAEELECADSPWRPFLDVLPVGFPDAPVFRGGDELAPLAGTAARHWAADAREVIVSNYASFPASTRARVSLAAYAWGRVVVHSRGFDAPFTFDPRIAFIPIIDLMDHRRDETAWQYRVDRNEYVLYALRDFAAGEPVHFTYGTYGNTHLLVEYGFALPDNPYDEAVLFLGGEPLLVRAEVNEQLAHALTLASPAEIGAEARRRLAAIDENDGGRNATDWETTCALVRRGERETLAWIVDYSCDMQGSDR